MYPVLDFRNRSRSWWTGLRGHVTSAGGRRRYLDGVPMLEAWWSVVVDLKLFICEFVFWKCSSMRQLSSGGLEPMLPIVPSPVTSCPSMGSCLLAHTGCSVQYLPSSTWAQKGRRKVSRQDPQHLKGQTLGPWVCPRPGGITLNGKQNTEKLWKKRRKAFLFFFLFFEQEALVVLTNNLSGSVCDCKWERSTRIKKKGYKV